VASRALNRNCGTCCSSDPHPVMGFLTIGLERAFVPGQPGHAPMHRSAPPASSQKNRTADPPLSTPSPPYKKVPGSDSNASTTFTTRPRARSAPASSILPLDPSERPPTFRGSSPVLAGDEACFFTCLVRRATIQQARRLAFCSVSFAVRGMTAGQRTRGSTTTVPP